MYFLSANSFEAISEMLMMNAMMVIGAIILVCIIINTIIAFEMDRIAAIKGHPEKRWFWYCFFFGLAGWIMVAALPDRNR